MTRFDVRAATAALGLGLVLASGAAAHEDDPKILDRKAPFPGTGYTAANQNLAGLGGTSNSLGFPANRMSLRSWLTMSDLGNGGENGSDCWGYVSPSGREYALMCTTGATVVVEVTNPQNPQVIGRINGPNSTWRDVKTYQDRAYTVSEGGSGIQVINLSQVDNGVVSLERTVTGQGTDATHNIAIDEVSGFLYRTGGGGNGLRIYSLANPGNPVFVGQYGTRYVHDAQIVTYTSGPYNGRQIAYCCSGFNGGSTDTGLTILDVTNKSNITVLSQLSYPSRQYSHQGWLSEDRTRFYLGDELDEGSTVSTTTTRVFDVTDPGNASYIGVFNNGDPAIGHNMYSHNGLLFQANYTSGLRVFDIDGNDLNPSEVAFFDTAPTSSAASFNGLWSCYPYFPSGTIIGSDIERGLFVLSLDGIQLDVVGGAPAVVDPNGEQITVDVTELTAGALDPASVALVYDTGAGFTTASMAQSSGLTFTIDTPTMVCGSAIDWYITASTNAGAETTMPSGGASAPFSSVAALGETVIEFNDMESTVGWTVGAPGDNATTGIWTRGNPIGTAAQPENDHSTIGAQCWFTGQGSNGGSVGENDVDGGRTTLVTDVIDMSTLTDPQLSYWRWFSNDQGASPNADVFRIQISNNGGSTWSALETVGPSGSGTAGGWIETQFRVADVITPTSQMRVRFIAADEGDGSIVEAAIDDFRVTDLDCGPPGGVYCEGVPNSTGQVATIASTGSNSVLLNDLVLIASGMPLNQFALFIASDSQTLIPNVGGGQGNLCVGPAVGRYLAQFGSTGFFGTLSLTVDTSAIITASGPVAALPGDTYNFQCWFRDVDPGPTSNLTRGFSVTFQ